METINKAKNKAKKSIYDKDKKCEKCGSTENLEFHHTDYKENKGFTLCRTCHRKKHIQYNYKGVYKK